jgi:predicted dehydrogenase
MRRRVLVIGSSFGGRVHVPGFARHPGFEVVGLAGSNEVRTRSIASELGVPRASSDWRLLLEELKPDVVAVVTPPDLHHPMTMAALEAGAHVLVEKPTALHAQQAVEMRDRARELGRVAGMNHEFRFYPARHAALEVVRAGGIGRPRRGDVSGRYSIWHRPESRGMTWLSDARRGGGILGALGSHHVDMLRTYFDEPRAVLASVRVDQPWRGAGSTAAGGTRATADDAFTLQLEFDDGATGLIDCSACVPYRAERFEIHGDDATLRWDEHGYTLWRLAPGRDPEEVEIPAASRLEPRDGDPPNLAPFGVMVERMHRALEGGVPCEPSLDDGVAVQAVLDAARASSAAGTRIEVMRPERAIAR